LRIGGDKTGDDRWYDVNVPIGERMYDERLEELRNEGKKMAKKFSALRAKMKPEAQKRAAAMAQTMLDEMPLKELRQARGLSQKMLAELLQVQQPSIAKIEKRTDMYLSTLRSHIEAMGGELDVVARFPDGTVKISHFSDLDKAARV